VFGKPGFIRWNYQFCTRSDGIFSYSCLPIM